MGDECPFCNELTLSWEEFGNFQGDCAGCRVCTSCGGVVEENNLTADEGIRTSGQVGTDTYTQATAKERQQYNIRCGAPSISKGRREGVNFTKRIAHYMDCKPSMIAQAVELFERLVEHRYFKSRRIAAKLAIAACSVYIICRQHNWPVILADVCGMAGVSINAADSWRKRIITTFPDLADVRAPDLFELLSSRCEKAAVSNHVQQIAAAIIKLCRDLWITEGRKQDNVIVPALFIAWQSEDPVSRVKVKLRNFCHDHELPIGSKCAVTCLSNMRQTLCLLASKIPWVTTSCITDSTIAFHVNDVVNYRSTLIAEARSEILRIQYADDCDIAHGNPDSDVTSSASTPEMSSITIKDTYVESTVTVDTNLATSSNAGLSCCVATTPNKEFSVTSNTHTMKRQHVDYYESFWPPPGYNPYKRIRKEDSKVTVNHPDMDCINLNSHDIPDEDMHLYIKHAEEQL